MATKMDNVLDESQSIHPELNPKAVEVESCLVDATN
jgi:hypothetical protein